LLIDVTDKAVRWRENDGHPYSKIKESSFPTSSGTLWEELSARDKWDLQPWKFLLVLLAYVRLEREKKLDL
jgi:hypothetical protein